MQIRAMENRASRGMTVFRYFWRKKLFFFPTPPSWCCLTGGSGESAIGGGIFVRSKRNFSQLIFMLSRNFWQKKEGVGIFFFHQKLRDSINISYEKFRFYPTSLTPQNADSPLPPVRQHQQGGSKKKFFFSPKVVEYQKIHL